MDDGARHTAEDRFNDVEEWAPAGGAVSICELHLSGQQLGATIPTTARPPECTWTCSTVTGMRQEVDIQLRRHVAQGHRAAPLRGRLLPGRADGVIKLHKAQLASDRMSCHSATANQVRLVLHTAAFWLMHGVRAAIPQTSPLAKCEFATIRERLIKIGARVIEHIARIRVQLPTSFPEAALFRTIALRLMPCGP